MTIKIKEVSKVKAIVQTNYEGVSGLQIKDVNESILSPLTVRVENHYIPVLPYDWETEYGLLKEIRPVSLPIIVGYGFAGVVEETGVFRSKNLVGKKVIGAQPNGAAMEMINSQIPPLLFEVPENVDLKDAVTLIGGADAALNAVNVSNIVRGDVVLVTGASGGVGTYLMQLLHKKGAIILALTASSNIDFVREIGADFILNYERDLADQLGNVPLPNKIIDTVGKTTILDDISSSVAKLDILSLSLTNYQPKKNNQRFKFSHDSIGISGYKKLLQMLSRKELSAYVQEIFSFEDVKKAHLKSKDEHSQGRILLRFN